MRLLSCGFLLLFLVACNDHVMPGIGFGPGGRLIRVEPERLQREAELIVEEAVNQDLGPHWFAEVAIAGEPVEYPDEPYARRWSWPEAAIAIRCIGDGTSKAPPVSPAELRRRAIARMQTATSAEDAISATVELVAVSPEAFAAAWPTWRERSALVGEP